MFKAGPVAVAATAGVAYLNNQSGADGSAATVGLQATMPITKQISIGAGVVRQYGQDRVQQFDGTRATVAVKYRF